MTLDELAFFAFRYALGRQTYVVSSMADHLIEYWTTFHVNHQRMIHKEILDAILNGRAGDENIDVPEWKRVLDMPIGIEGNG